jgi:hypothetical protein
MKKLIDAYRANPIIANAMRIVIYARRHPMAACLLTQEDAAILEKARMELRPVAEKLASVVQGEAF